MKRPEKKKKLRRSVLLPILIGYTGWMIIDLVLRPFPDNPRIGEIIDSIVIFALAIAIWNWKRWVAYGLGVTGLILIIYAVYDPSSLPTFVILAIMVQIAVWIYFYIFIWKKQRLVVKKLGRGHAGSRK